MSAANVGHRRTALELRRHAVERRQPFGDKVVTIAGPEEPFGATEQAAMVLMPADTTPGAERLLDARRCPERRLGNLEEACQKRRTALLGENYRLFRLEAERIGVGVIRDVIGCRLSREPFADMRLRRASAAGERRGRHRAGLGECLVQPQPVPDDDEGRAQRGPHVAEHAPEETVQPFLIDLCLHRMIPNIASDAGDDGAAAAMALRPNEPAMHGSFGSSHAGERHSGNNSGHAHEALHVTQ